MAGLERQSIQPLHDPAKSVHRVDTLFGHAAVGRLTLYDDFDIDPALVAEADSIVRSQTDDGRVCADGIIL
jgi:hypothetical protein